MNKKSVYTVVLLILLTITAYFFISTKAAAPKPIQGNEIEALAQSENVNLLAYTIANNVPQPFAITLVTFGDKIALGTVTTKDHKLEFQSGLETKRDKTQTIEMLGVATGYAHTAIVVNDPKLIYQPNTLSVTFQNGFTQTASLMDKNAHVFIDSTNPQSYSGLQQIRISDPSGKTLYTREY